MFTYVISPKDSGWGDTDRDFACDFYCSFGNGFDEQLRLAYAFLKEADAAYEKRCMNNPRYADAELQAAIQEGMKVIPKAFRRGTKVSSWIPRLDELTSLCMV